MADPINHDSASTVATVGGNIAKWGILGGLLGAAALPVFGGVVIAAATAAITAAAGYGAVAGVAAILGGIVGVIGGAVTAGVAIPGIVATSAVTGAAVGVFKGADQVSKETSAFRSKVTERMNDRGNKDAKMFNDGEVKGLDEGYALAAADLKPQLEAAREAGRQEGAQAVVEQIQQHMQQEMAAQQNAEGHGKHLRVDAGHDKAHAGPKQPVQIGSKVIASCECPDGSKAAAIAEQRQAEAGHALS